VNDERDEKASGSAPSAEGEGSAVVAQQREESAPQQLRMLVDLEKQRIDSYNRRTDVARYAIEMNDAADKRQFEYRMAELDAGKTSSQRRHTLAKNIAIGAGFGGGAIIALLLIMAFFGSSSQSAMAIQIFIILGIGVGGYGAIEAVVRAISKLFKEQEA